MPAAMNLQPLKREAVNSMRAHVDRTGRIGDHIDPERTPLNQTLIDRREALGPIPTHQPSGRKVRSDANVLCSMICTLPQELDKENEKDLQAWTKATMEWVGKQVSGQIELATLHRDESRPHIHIHIRPVDDTGKLNWRAHFHGRQTLRDLQKSYSDHLEPLGVIPHSEAEKEVLKRGYTKGIHGWRVGRAVLDAQAQVREKSQELKALTPPENPITIKRPRLFSPSAEWWQALEQKWSELKGQMLAWRSKATLLEGRLAERDYTIQELSGHVHKLARRLLDRTPDKERLPLARELRSLGIKARAFDRIIAKDSARQWERGRERGRGLGL